MKKFNFEEQDEGLNNILNKNEKKSLEKSKAEKQEKTATAATADVKESSTPVKDKKDEESVNPVEKKAPTPVEAGVKEEKITENNTPSSSSETKSLSNILASEKRETKSVKKIILIRPTLADALKTYSKKYGISENEVINRILENYILD